LAALVLILIVGLTLLRCFGRFRVVRSEKGRNEKFLAIYDRKQPIWSEWDFGQDGRQELAYSFFFNGKDVLLLAIDQNQRVKGCTVTCRDDSGKPRIMYEDHTGSGEFTDRIIYGNAKPYYEICLPGTWIKLEKRGSLPGVMLDGQWHAVQYTNGAWTVCDNAGAQGSVVGITH